MFVDGRYTFQAKEQIDKSIISLLHLNNFIEELNKNIIKDKIIGSFILRKQDLKDFPPKELRNIVDASKKEIKEGIVVIFSTFEEKVGVAVGITKNLSEKYDAVTLVKIASNILGGKGGVGRSDFAQAGGSLIEKIDESFEKIKNLIN